MDGVTLILDPFISPNPMASAIDVAELRADFVLLSHGHQDHVVDAELIAKNSDATIVAAFEIASYYGAKGLKYHPMNIGGTKDFGTWKVKAVNAVHSSVLPDGTYAGNPMGWLITIGGKTLYFSGDTALTMDMQLIPMWAKLDAAILCMGDNFTMGIDDAVLAAEFVKCNNIVGMHFDTFPYIKINHEDAIASFKKSGKTLHLPAIGESIEI